jgi:hypothetical protein
MPLKKALRGIHKKALIQLQSISSEYPSISKAVMKFFLANKRYLFYLGYPPIVILSVFGVLIQNIWLSLIFPLYFALYLIVQIKKRGFARGLNAAVRSILVGVPTTYVLLYYSAKLSFRRAQF